MKLRLFLRILISSFTLMACTRVFGSYPCKCGGLFQQDRPIISAPPFSTFELDHIAQKVMSENNDSLYAPDHGIQKKLSDANIKIEPHLRFYPGSLLKDSWRKTDLFRQAEFYRAFANNSTLVEQMYTYWYPLEVKYFPDFKRVLPETLLPLALDPGISSRAEIFLKFASNYLVSHADAKVIELREAFSQFLGAQKAYRVLALNDLDYNRILDQGLRARGASFSSWESSSKMERLEREMTEWDYFLRYGPLEVARKRIAMTGIQFLQSITQFPEVGVFVASRFAKTEGSLYLFELRIPVIDVVTTEQTGYVSESAPFKTLDKVHKIGEPGVEDFVFGNIDKNWIVSIQSVDKDPTSQGPYKLKRSEPFVQRETLPGAFNLGSVRKP